MAIIFSCLIGSEHGLLFELVHFSRSFTKAFSLECMCNRKILVRMLNATIDYKCKHHNCKGFSNRPIKDLYFPLSYLC